MENLMLYLIKASVLLIIFYFSYELLLKKETSFELNRKFLFFGIFTAAFLPFIYLTRKVFIHTANTGIEYLPTATGAQAIPIEETINWWNISGYFYLIITGFFLLRFLIQLSSVLRIILLNRSESKAGYKFIRIQENQPPFSFFNYIVFNPQSHSKRDLDLIIEHEKVHANQFHSIDILLANLCQSFLWFNPFSRLYKKRIEQNLEFIADKETVNNQVGIKEYQHALVKVSVAELKPALTNHFYQSFIKKRILMLNTNSSKQSPAWKLGLVMPFLLAFMLLFNVKTEAQIVPQEKTKSATEKPKVKEEQEKTAPEVIELEEEEEMIEEPEKVKVEIHEAPKLSWRTIQTAGPVSQISELGTNPLYVINGKKFKASKLHHKYIGLKSNPQILSAENALKAYGDDAENGAIIIPDAKLIRNFDKELKDLKSQESFKGRYIIVGENGKPNFLNLNSSKNLAGTASLYTVAGNTPGILLNTGDATMIKGWGYSTDPKPGKVYVTSKALASGNKKVYRVQTDTSNTIGFAYAGDPTSANGTGVKVFAQNGDPLFVIDGEVQTEGFDPETISSSNIKSINVIKGEGGIKKYGKKAKNGLIEIYTKTNGTAAENNQLIKINAEMTDAELEEIKIKLKKLTGIELEIDNVFRNNGLITSISIHTDKDGKQIGNANFSDSNSIPIIYVGLSNGASIIKSSRD